MKSEKMMMALVKDALVGELKKAGLLLGMAAIAVLVILAGWAWIRALQADIGRLEALNDQLLTSAAEAGQKLAAAKAETAGLARELERSYQALEARDAEKKRLQAEKEAQQAQICEVVKNDQTANDWINAAVPNPMVDRLCRPLPVPAAQAAPGRIPSGCAGAAVKNGDLVNWILNLQEALRQSNSDKAALRDWVGNVFNSSTQ